VSGAVDADLSKLKANEMMMWGLANMWKGGKEGRYLVKHGGQPVNDFSKTYRTQNQSDEVDDTRPNFFEKAFPCLFPWGKGGIERDRPVAVDFSSHVKWCLQYFDRQFRKHETFPFVAFGISQRCQALGSARIQM
jgi:hypothetical protein